MNDPVPRDYDDISATEFKKRFGKTLEDVAHGKAVRIIRHGRRSDSLVLMREDELNALRERVSSPLDELRDQFDQLVARMQTPDARTAAASIGTASSKDLGKAALKGIKRGG